MWDNVRYDIVLQWGSDCAVYDGQRYGDPCKIKIKEQFQIKKDGETCRKINLKLC